jgi:L-seryl-tRNA(Ser) seleniumtransferase
VAVSPGQGPEAFTRTLREGDPPVVARVTGERVLLDVRTVDPSEEDDLVNGVKNAMKTRT